MSEKSNPTPGEPLESQANGSQSTPAEGHKVGPGRPPADTRWKKGGPSPNPRGRPRKVQTSIPDLGKALERAISKKVRVSRGNRKVSLTRGEIAVEQFLNQAASGDRHAMGLLLDIAKKAGIDVLGNNRQQIEQAITARDQVILDRYVERRTGPAQVIPAERVLAPPQLLDDDLDETKKETTREKVKQEVKQSQPPQKLDQAGYGAGCPPPGGRSLTTGKWT